jgi:L-ascorbate metabolism protein UlaG (beta-lactamase superfamily)
MPARPLHPLSDHCDGRRFFNQRNHVNPGWLDVLKWRLTSRPAVWPDRVAIAAQPPPPLPADGQISATWVNHATFLLQTSAGNILTDPIFGERASPFPWAGPRRVHAPGLALDQLPRIDVVLLSHDHYDHCHLPTLRQLAARHQPLVLTPLGNAALAARAGLRHCIELDWWQRHTLASGLQVSLTPARHWSNRLSGARNGRLWGGFHLQAAGQRIYFAGDTGYDSEMFKAIGRAFGPPDLALIPIGAYEPRWFMAAQHCNPAEAVQIHRDVGSRLSVAMHWGAFQLTDESREAPPQDLAAALASAGLTAAQFRTLDPGENVLI